MASIYKKRGKWWARVKGDKEPGKWSGVPTGYPIDEKEAALEWAEEAQKQIDARRQQPDTFRAYVATWLEKRREAGHDWKKDRGRLTKHVLPTLGGLRLRDITSAHLVQLVHELRFQKKLANRTVRNVYTVIVSAFRDARLDGLIAQTPCVLTEKQLGSVSDKDPEWRAGAVFTRAEAEQLLSDPRIPLDRRLVYGFGLLAGLRPGEAAALRLRNYDATSEPLGKLTVALAYSTSRSQTKRTKTEAVRHVPVHPALAALLSEWIGAGEPGGWHKMMGRTPGPDDLIVPLPPEVKRTRRTGDRYRGWDYTGRRWREVDLPMLGWRDRSVYDTKSTFITLAIEDGTDPVILRDRVTHTKSRRDAFTGYDRGPHWIQTCHEVSKLKLGFLATTCDRYSAPSDIVDEVGSGGGFRTPDGDAPKDTGAQAEPQVRVTTCDFGRSLVVASRAPTTGENNE